MKDLARRSLYLCVGHREDMARFLPAVLRGGVDLVQLREKALDDDARAATAAVMAPICADFGVPFIVNDSPELAHFVGADGVHVGQDDVSVAHCREVLGPDAIVGLSTHSTTQFDAALDEPVSYVSAGPLRPTPTKPGRPGTGVEYAISCQRRSPVPVFVTGGVNTATLPGLVAVGLRHFVVVRALTESPDPEGTARDLRREIDAI